MILFSYNNVPNLLVNESHVKVAERVPRVHFALYHEHLDNVGNFRILELWAYNAFLEAKVLYEPV